MRLVSVLLLRLVSVLMRLLSVLLRETIVVRIFHSVVLR